MIEDDILVVFVELVDVVIFVGGDVVVVGFVLVDFCGFGWYVLIDRDEVVVFGVNYV